METDKLVYVDTSNKEIRLNYSKTRSQKIKELNKIFETNGVDLVQISTGEDYVKPLVNFFKRRGKRK
jgi:tagatose-1,6-bisphosphate aldolase